MYHLPFWRKWHEILSLSTNTSTIVICIQIKIILIYFLGLFSWSIFTQLVSLSSVDKSELLNSHSESCKCQWLNMAVGALRYFPPLPVCHFILTENKLIFFQSNICFMLKEHHLIKFSAGRCLLVFFFSPHFLWFSFWLKIYPSPLTKLQLLIDLQIRLGCLFSLVPYQGSLIHW